MADLVESRDRVTGGHIDRTSGNMKILAEALLEHNVYAKELREMDFTAIISSSRLHDIGKIAISDTILNKPDKLTTSEFEIMKTHCMEGEQIIDRLVARTSNMDFCYYAKSFAGSHHERWDGGGYPRGLAKKGFTHDTSLEIIMNSAGSQFDPYIADVFYKVSDKFVG